MVCLGIRIALFLELFAAQNFQALFLCCVGVGLVENWVLWRIISLFPELPNLVPVDFVVRASVWGVWGRGGLCSFADFIACDALERDSCSLCRANIGLGRTGSPFGGFHCFWMLFPQEVPMRNPCARVCLGG